VLSAAVLAVAASVLHRSAADGDRGSGDPSFTPSDGLDIAGLTLAT
jgi:hypothetical protein